jgi:hypothetical protein
VIQFVSFYPPPSRLHENLRLVIFIFEKRVKRQPHGRAFFLYLEITYFDNFFSKLFPQSTIPLLVLSHNARALRRTERASDARGACTGAYCYWSDGLLLNETALLKKPTMAPVNITVADILSHFS